jgi:2-oxoglutarate ferredoxin oxidoreductase subunit gamma
MQTEIIIAGFGGQGVLFAGQLMAYTAMDEGLNVTWFPSYGPEMRGGTANCTIIISDNEIGAAVVRNPEIAIIMTLPSLDKYEPLIKPGGLLVLDSAMVEQPVKRRDIKVVTIPATRIAEQIGNRRMANMVLLGALLANHIVLPAEMLKKTLQKHLPERHKRLLPANFEALSKGALEFELLAV